MEQLANDVYEDESKYPLLSRIDKKYYPHFYRALGAALATFDLKYGYICNKVNKRYLADFYEGRGRTLLDGFMFSDCTAEELVRLINTVERKYRRAIYKGIGGELASAIKAEPANIIFWQRLKDKLPAECKKYCEIGCKKQNAL